MGLMVVAVAAVAAASQMGLSTAVPAKVMGCGPYSSVRIPPVSARDVRAGPVTVIAFAQFADESARNVYRPGPHGEFILKFPVVISGGRAVTLTVPPAERARLAIAVASADDELREGVLAARYEACPREGRATGYAGALVYAGRWGRCVPMTVRVAGERRALTMRLPLGVKC